MQELLASQVKYTWSKIQGSRLTVIYFTDNFRLETRLMVTQKNQDNTRMEQFKRQRSRVRNQEMYLDLFKCMEFDDDVNFFCFGPEISF